MENIPFVGSKIELINGSIVTDLGPLRINNGVYTQMRNVKDDNGFEFLINIDKIRTRLIPLTDLQKGEITNSANAGVEIEVFSEKNTWENKKPDEPWDFQNKIYRVKSPPENIRKEIEKAFMEGESIERYIHGSNMGWSDYLGHEPPFDWISCSFRMKKAPFGTSKSTLKERNLIQLLGRVARKKSQKDCIFLLATLEEESYSLDDLEIFNPSNNLWEDFYYAAGEKVEHYKRYKK